MCSGQLSLLPSAGREMSSSLGLRGEGLVWLVGAVVCLLAANRGSNCLLTRAMDGRIVRCGIISSCQSAATSEIVKCFWSRTHIRSAITSIATFTFTFTKPDTQTQQHTHIQKDNRERQTDRERHRDRGRQTDPVIQLE